MRSIPVSDHAARYYAISYNYLFAILETDIHKGRELLNAALYRAMQTRESTFLVSPLAIYVLALAQRDRSSEALAGHAKFDWIRPHCLQWFESSAQGFGHPFFVSPEFTSKYLATRPKKQRAQASALVKLVTELRATLDGLALDPVLVDTGQYQPKYEKRTFLDMRNQIVRDLTQQPNYQAKVRLLTGEAVIQTHEAQPGLTGAALQKRIDGIKLRMVFPTVGHCRYYQTVDQEVRVRQERLTLARPSQTPSRTGGANQTARVLQLHADPPPTRG